MKKGGSLLAAVLNGFTGCYRMLLTFCGAVHCQMAWLLAGLAVLEGSVG